MKEQMSLLVAGCRYLSLANIGGRGVVNEGMRTITALVVLVVLVALGCSPTRTRVWTGTRCIAVDDGTVQRAWVVDVNDAGKSRIAEVSWRDASERIRDLPAARPDPRPAMAWPAPPHE